MQLCISKQSVSGPQWSQQLMCLLHSANCQLAKSLNLEKSPISADVTAQMCGEYDIVSDIIIHPWGRWSVQWEMSDWIQSLH